MRGDDWMRESNEWMSEPSSGEDRAVTYTVEAVVGLAIVATVVVSISTGLLIVVDEEDVAQQAAENELEQHGDSALKKAETHGAVKQTILSWDTDEDEWAPPGSESEDGELVTLPENTFGVELNRLMDQEDVLVNVYLYPVGATGEVVNDESLASGAVPRADPITLYSSGTPGDRSVSVTTTIPLYESDRLQPTEQAHKRFPTDSQKTRSGEERLRAAGVGSTYPIPPSVNTVEVYNIVEVEVVIWNV